MGYVDLQRRTEDRSRGNDVGHDPLLLSTLGFGLATPASWFSFSMFWSGWPLPVVVAPLVPSAVLVLLSVRVLWRKGASDATRGPGTEKQLLVALRDSDGSVTPIEAALETSLTVDEAEERLSSLATRGHLTIEHRGGALSYALPGKQVNSQFRVGNSEFS